LNPGKMAWKFFATWAERKLELSILKQKVVNGL